MLWKRHAPYQLPWMVLFKHVTHSERSFRFPSSRCLMTALDEDGLSSSGQLSQLLVLLSKGLLRTVCLPPLSFIFETELRLTLRSWNVHRSTYDSWLRYPVLYHFWFGDARRTGIPERATFLDCAVQLIVFHRVVDSCRYHDGH